MSKPRWDGDLLGRHRFGDFLYDFIIKRHESQDGEDAICCAIDGNWGEGKTFFINHWSNDIRGKQHPVITFDAWKNDHHKDPLLAFISHLNNELAPFIDKTPLAPRAANALKEKSKKIFLQAGKAAIPLGVATIKNQAIKIIGEEGGEIFEGMIKTGGPIISEKDIEKFLESTFKDYATKNKSIEKVKTDLEKLTEEFSKIDNVRAPIFIIVDELDRCRPDYAISLLEGIKHILNAKGIIFVISTNITQLTESVKALYGQGFDGRRYLRRFFDFDYQLPERSAIEYITHIIKSTALKNPKFTHSGLYIIDRFSNKEVEPEECITAIFEYFSIDLRTAKQIITKAECFIALQPAQEKTNLAYLIALCCLDVVNENAIESLILDPIQNISELNRKPGANAKYTIAHTSAHGTFGKQEKLLSEILNNYQRSSKRSIIDFHKIESPNCFENNIFELVDQSSDTNPLEKYTRQIKKMTQYKLEAFK